MIPVFYVDNRGDPCLFDLEKSGFYDFLNLPDEIVINNPDYEDDEDTDEEYEGEVLVRGPHDSTIHFILEHIKRHGMSKVDPKFFEEQLLKYAVKENLEDLYDEVFEQVYGYPPKRN